MQPQLNSHQTLIMPMPMPTSTSDHENYDPTFPDQPVVELYLPIWAKLPAFQDKPAFVWVEGDSDITSHNPALTYGQLNDSADRVASWLKSTPLRRGDVVVIMCPPGLELIEMIFGCQRAGICIIPILPLDTSVSHHHHHLIRVLSQTKPKAAIATAQYIARVSEYVSACTTGKKQQQKLPQLLQKLQWISTEDLKSLPPSRSPYSGTRAEEVYLIQYTSGATGTPKPVLATAGSAAHNVRAARKAYDLHPNTTIASWLPQYHDCGLMFLLLTVVSGATCVLTSPNAFLKRPRLWLEMVSEFKATCTPVPSFALPLVVRRGGGGGVAGTGKLAVRLGSLKNLILINEPIYGAAVEEFVEAFRCCGLEASAISPSYGLAENCTFVSTAWRPPSLSDTNSAGNFLINVLPTYKRLLPSARLDGDGDDVDMHIVVVNEETSSLVDDGVEGEIWVSSPSNCSGYLGHPSLTREIFHSRLTCQTGRRYLRTGDRGVISGDERYLFVTGRSADLIRLPENDVIIHPHYIESAAYASFPKILRGGCVAAVERWRGSVAVVAELQRREKAEELRRVAEGIRKVVLEKERLEVEAVVLVVSGSVPKTTSGKLQRWLTKEKLRKGEMQVVMAMEVGDGDHGEGRRRYHEGTSSISKASKEEEDGNDGGEVAYSFSGDTSPRQRLVSFL